ncbi:MAG: hypothetical protein U7127_02385 [Phormidium sp.]
MEYSPAQTAIAANIQALAICERDYKKAQAEADKWENLYQRALKAKSDDSVIKEIVFYKKIHAKKARKLKAMLDEQKEKLDNLKLETRLRELESDLEAMKYQLLKQQAATEQMLQLNATALSELREMIKQNCLTKPDSNNSVTLPSSSPSKLSVDEDLEKLKKHMDKL